MAKSVALQATVSDSAGGRRGSCFSPGSRPRDRGRWRLSRRVRRPVRGKGAAGGLLGDSRVCPASRQLYRLLEAGSRAPILTVRAARFANPGRNVGFPLVPNGVRVDSVNHCSRPRGGATGLCSSLSRALVRNHRNIPGDRLSGAEPARMNRSCVMSH